MKTTSQKIAIFCGEAIMLPLPIDHDKRHRKQADHNCELLHENCFPDPCTVENLKYKDWTTTVAFYSALHYIEAYLHFKGFRTKFDNHRERNDYLKNVASVQDKKINKILQKYIELCNLSWTARYTACHYHYIDKNVLCKYVKFALLELPKELSITL